MFERALEHAAELNSQLAGNLVVWPGSAGKAHSGIELGFDKRENTVAFDARVNFGLLFPVAVGLANMDCATCKLGRRRRLRKGKTPPDQQECSALPGGGSRHELPT